MRGIPIPLYVSLPVSNATFVNLGTPGFVQLDTGVIQLDKMETMYRDNEPIADIEP